MKNDFISRQAAISAFEPWLKVSGYSVGELNMLRAVIYELRTMPSAIIHCRDCRYYEIAQIKKDGTDDKRYKPSCCVNGAYARYRKPDWFCGDAERKEDE